MPLTKDQQKQIEGYVDQTDASFFCPFEGSEKIRGRKVIAYHGPMLRFGKHRINVARYNRDQVSTQFGNDVWKAEGHPVVGTLSEVVLRFETKLQADFDGWLMDPEHRYL